MGEKKIFYLDPDDRKWTMEDLGLSWDDLLDRKEKKEKTIEGTFFVKNGKIIEWSELPDHCPECLEQLCFNEEFDSIYCLPCNEWRDVPCSDPSCEFCLERPKKPSDCE